MLLYGPKEYAQVTKNYAETCATTIATFAYGGAWTLGIGAGLSLVVNTMATKISANMLERHLKPHPPNHKFSPNLQTMMDKLYDLSGLDVEGNPVYDFRLDNTKEPTKGEKALGQIFEKMAAVPNAAASNINEPVIMISEHLLQLLSDDEEYAVLAHEFMHAAADHQWVSMPKKYLTTAAAITSTLVSGLEYLQSGFWGVASSMVAGGITASLFKTKPKDARLERDHFSLSELASEKIMDAGKHVTSMLGMRAAHKRFERLSAEAKREDKARTPEELLSRKRTKAMQQLATQVTSVGAASAFNPAYAPIYAATKTVNTVLLLSSKKLSRIFEFHADKGAVTKFEANPLALITALRKINAVVERSQRNANGFANSDVKVSRMGRQWQEMKATHPSVPRRAEALSAIARKAGYSEEDIDAAVHGPLDLGNVDDIPLEMAEQAAMMLHMDDHMQFGYGHS